VIQQHCEGYKKYRGPTHFEKLGRGRFRLIASVKPKFTLTPIASDIQEPSQPERVKQETYRILRDTALAREIKEANGYRCQICGQTLRLKEGKPYAETHHIKPLGAPYNGPDVRGNILCVCPNHHVLLDYGAIKFDSGQMKGVDSDYIDYHNQHIFGEA
jgi:predicted restriction endonuclease